VTGGFCGSNPDIHVAWNVDLSEPIACGVSGGGKCVRGRHIPRMTVKFHVLMFTDL
jgi:hypothetical protein